MDEIQKKQDKLNAIKNRKLHFIQTLFDLQSCQSCDLSPDNLRLFKIKAKL